MNINKYRNDSRFSSNTNAFHAGGTWKDDKFNQRLLKKIKQVSGISKKGASK